MIEAMIAGEDDPKNLANLSKGNLRAKRPQLEDAFGSSVGQHQRLMLESLLRLADSIDTEVARMDDEVLRRLGEANEVIDRLDEIPGIGRRAAEEVIAEIGLDMSRFPTSAHLASWAHPCPCNELSAGKRKGGSAGHGDSWLRRALVEAGWSAAPTKKSYFYTLYHRLAGRRGTKRVLVAVAHALLIVIYSMIRKGTTYSDLGTDYLDERRPQSVIYKAAKRIEALGYRVTPEAA